jgi:hypothetical protein
MRFEQAVVGKTLSFFKENFMSRWDFKNYFDSEKPLVIFGYDFQDYLYENHKGYKLIIPSIPTDVPNFQNLTNHKKTIYVGEKIENTPKDIIFKNETIEIKDYSIFKPNILKDKIYYYSGFRNGWDIKRFDQELIEEIQKKIKYEIITTQHNTKSDYFDIHSLKNQYYDKTFLNLNLLGRHGMTTVREMGLMGRKTITMTNVEHYKYNCIINCSNIEEVIGVINKESQKIGTIQPSINSHTVGDEWLNIEYWIETNE